LEADAMANEKRDQPPTEKTPKTGIEVPIPKRGEFFANLKKVAGKTREPAGTKHPPR
jgi:hypothetical protein